MEEMKKAFIDWYCEHMKRVYPDIDITILTVPFYGIEWDCWRTAWESAIGRERKS